MSLKAQLDLISMLTAPIVTLRKEVSKVKSRIINPVDSVFLGSYTRPRFEHHARKTTELVS